MLSYIQQCWKTHARQNHDNDANITHLAEILREQEISPLSYTRIAPASAGGSSSFFQDESACQGLLGGRWVSNGSRKEVIAKAHPCSFSCSLLTLVGLDHVCWERTRNRSSPNVGGPGLADGQSEKKVTSGATNSTAAHLVSSYWCARPYERPQACDQR